MTLYVWLLPNNNLYFKIKNSYVFEDIGDINGYGWKLISIQKIYNGRFIDYRLYDKYREKKFIHDKYFKKKLIFLNLIF